MARAREHTEHAEDVEDVAARRAAVRQAQGTGQ